MEDKNLLTEWARLFATSVADAGITDVVLSPGARSAPWMVALVSEPRLTCYDVIDERAAAFFALGQARVTGRPSMLLCSSGTAGAHYFPAVIEAAAAYLPLLVVTADRPVELQACGAHQTIDQLNLYGQHARRFFDAGMPDSRTESFRALRRTVFQAVLATRHPLPGAVHINMRARKPLEPTEAVSPSELDLKQRVQKLATGPAVMSLPPRLHPERTALATSIDALKREERGVIVCGPAPMEHAQARDTIYQLAARLGYPVLVETPSQLRLAPPPPAGVTVVDRFELLFRSKTFCAQAAPKLTIELGKTPTAAGWEQFLGRESNLTRLVISPHGWIDPHGTATVMLQGDPETTLRALLDGAKQAGIERTDRTYGNLYATANRAAAKLIESNTGSRQAPLRHGSAMRAVVESLPAGSVFAIGNSLALREVDVYCPAHSAQVDVVCQRGANGIDGLIAGAAGSAHASRRPVTLLLGDVSFLHDLSALHVCRGVTTPLVICVVQNRGGRIFELLPMADAVDEATINHIITPHDTDLSAVAPLYGIRFERARTWDEATACLQRAHAHAGCTVVELIVPDHDAVQTQRRILASIDAALTEVMPSGGADSP